ncbi:MAG: alpha/beta hydrolase fold domain-containing protein [Actinomycetota bacterium]
MVTQSADAPAGRSAATPDVDVVVVGAGMAGIYLLYRLRELGFSAVALEAADDVGGTWYWNRYPGARCDIQSVDYSYSFDPELEHEWQWSEKYATQPEILRYLQHVTDKHDLRSMIRFSTRVDGATWDEAGALWRVRTTDGDEITGRHYVMATGCLSQPKSLDIEGAATFEGDVYVTGRWPHDGVDFTGKRVAVIGTGSSGIQSIPLIAAEAAEMTVFQRTPNFSVPAFNGPIPEAKAESIRGRESEYREEARWSRGGVPGERSETPALSVTDAERQDAFEAAWAAGELFAILGPFADLLVNEAANDTMADFIRSKIRERVNDPATAELLCPTNHPFGTKRPCLDSGYFETYNQPHVRLVDLLTTPIERITPTGIETSAETVEVDAIVYATGFDAMTGAIVAVDIEGRDGLALADKWTDGPRTYLGLTTVGFPNYFMVTGPGSPSVLSNMVVSIEQHVDWIAECLTYMRSEGLHTIEPTPTAEAGWGQHVNDCADITLYPKANSWYMGANVVDKPRVFLPYIGGVDTYRQICSDVATQDYLGFAMSGEDEQRCHDGVIFRLQPDAAMVFQAMADLGLPPIESMPPEGAREFMGAMSAERPPGPAVGEIVDGTYPAATGDLAYRLYRPATPGPHPVVLYYHGGGWVLGSQESDDPLCRDLCVRSDAIIVSVDYRHAPEHPFPAPVDDAWAALQWVTASAESLGGRPGPVAVAGWSAGGNLAAVMALMARDAGGPELAGQLLFTPVTDHDLSRPSYVENAEGYVLTTALMTWFWDHYAPESERADWRASPLHAPELSGVAPAAIVTAEFDPLRDEGQAYADALEAAGVPVTRIGARGHGHTTAGMVDVVLSGAAVRAEMARAIQWMFGTGVAGSDSPSVPITSSAG